MKPYKERLPLIDEAIDNLDGELQDKDDYFVGVTTDCLHIRHTQYWYSSNPLCTRQEFDQRVNELRNKPSWKGAPILANYLSQDIDGQWWFHQHKPIRLNCGEWRQGGNHYAMGKGKVIGDWKTTLEERESMGKYEYGVEYPCSGQKPDLPDDVLVDVKVPGAIKNYWAGARTVKGSAWSSRAISFRIVDESYKPEHHIPDTGKKIESDWFESGELPPVGTECEVNDCARGLIKGLVIAHDLDEGHAVFKTDYGYSGYIQVKPLRTERDELIDKYTDKIMRDGNCNGDEMFTVEEAVALMYDNNWRPMENK